MSALGHKRPLRPIIAQRPLPGVKQPFLSSRIDGILRLDRECPLSPKAVVQISEIRVKRPAAFGQKRTFVGYRKPRTKRPTITSGRKLEI